MGFLKEVARLAAIEIHDRYQDGWDFVDAVRSVTPPGFAFAMIAEAYQNEWGFIPDDYTIDIFKDIDNEEGRQ